MNDTAPVAGKTLDTEQWRRMRKAAMKTQQDVATETGISLSTILAVETGQRNFGIENSVKFVKACKGSAAAKEHLRQFAMKVEKTCGL